MYMQGVLAHEMISTLHETEHDVKAVVEDGVC